MKRFLMLCTASLLFAAADPAGVGAQSPPPAAADRPLSEYRDRNRVLLVFAPNAQDAGFVEQNKLWKGEKAGMEERQLVVVPVLADAKTVEGVAPAVLAKKYGIEGKTFAVVLIGKDGHDAFRTAKPVKPEVVYGAVDAMPMRRAEMKRPPASVPPLPTATPRKPDLDHDE